jgi:hypothetical protein
MIHTMLRIRTRCMRHAPAFVGALGNVSTTTTAAAVRHVSTDPNADHTDSCCLTVQQDADEEVAHGEHLGRHVVLLDQHFVGEGGAGGEEVPHDEAAPDL